ncbi:LacI family DNA-binding transcriptional regulator [Pararhizobium sp. IMCC21322]|uniref:LacI family DNA-binding transcriptional regulator n=1 Tax=Pararhizobium sp. IMCC21322 TaxID=3067903 RepID=UPI002742815E|nr:LacI family DNA-binding transcriptional regulator [Pararhizobium sp. IMCC21322]
MKKPVLANRVTLGDIAKDTNLSTAAVSMALRGGSGVSSSTREKVQNSADRLGYIYDRSAALLRTGLSNTIGIVVGTVSNNFFGKLVSGVDDVIGDVQKISFLLNTREDPDRQNDLLTRMREQSVDGLILCPAPGTSRHLLETMDKWNMPIVQVMRSVSETKGDFVSADYQSGIEALCAHLIRLGHTHIAFVGGALDHLATRQRIKGFQTALGRARLDAGRIVRETNDSRGGRSAIAELLVEDNPPTAIVCFNDHVAMGVMAGVRAAGLTPGRDIAVAGFDNIDVGAEAFPALTTVETHGLDIGREAGQLLLRRIADPKMPSERIIIPTRLIIRQSCGADLSEENAQKWL